MKDNWIPHNPKGTFTPLSLIPDSAKVRYLLKEEGTGWEVDTVRAFFHEELANIILGIPISRRGSADFVSWPYDKFGIYTVKSAYNLARTASFFDRQGTAGRGASSDRKTDEKNWKAVWSI
jgi:hypothetical protein